MREPKKDHAWLPLILVVLIGLIGLSLRIALWNNLPRQGMISDEAEYLASAAWIANGRGFTWHQGWLWTRAPLYPLFLAAHIRLFGMHLAPIYITQTLLSLINIALVYLLAAKLMPHSHTPSSAHNDATTQRPNKVFVPSVVNNRHIPTLAGLLAALYFPFATHAQMLLSETLYLTLLLTLFIILAQWSEKGTALPHALVLLALAGCVAGLATLTRGLTLGFIPFIAGWIVFTNIRRLSLVPRPPSHIIQLASFIIACVCTVAPWSWYASTLYNGTIVVDTTGSFNLMLGARTAYDSGRYDANTRNFILALLDDSLSQSERRTMLADSCLWQHQDPHVLDALEQPTSTISQGQRQSLMTREGLCLLRTAPGAFVRKSFRETIDFFRINYTGDERMSGGFTQGRLPRWYALALFVLSDTLYILMLPLAIIAWFQMGTPFDSFDKLRDRLRERFIPLHVLIGLWVLYNLLTVPLLFAINRFRLPLMPFACIYAVAIHKPSAHRPSHIIQYAIALFVAILILPSYLGPYPSSLQATRMNWQARPTWQHRQHLIDALGSGNAYEARQLLDVPSHPDSATTNSSTNSSPSSASRPQSPVLGLPSFIVRLARPLVAGLEGNPEQGLSMLPDAPTIAAHKDWQFSVVRGDLLRRIGDEAGAKAAFTPVYVDDQNPVAWAWEWLYPIPTRHIDLAGNLDVGYIHGFYLGEGDPPAGGTFRWSGPKALLHFPQQGKDAPQELCLRADGRGWPTDMPTPNVKFSVLPRKSLHKDAQTQDMGTLNIQRTIEVYCITVPPTPPTSDITIMLESPTFVPQAADLLALQGPQVGQLRLLGVRLDWAELRAE